MIWSNIVRETRQRLHHHPPVTLDRPLHGIRPLLVMPRCVVIFGRVSTYEGPPEAINEMVSTTEQTAVPAMRDIPGAKGAMLLVDRNTGKSLTISLWESEDAMRESEDRANQLRAALPQGGRLGSAGWSGTRLHCSR